MNISSQSSTLLRLVCKMSEPGFWIWICGSQLLVINAVSSANVDFNQIVLWVLIFFCLGCGVPKQNLRGIPKALLRLMEPQFCGICNMKLENDNSSK